MNGDAGYALKKLDLAILLLATGRGDVRSRLLNAFHAELAVVQDSDFPDNLRPDWLWIKQCLTRKGPRVREDGTVLMGAVQNTLYTMHNKTGSRISERLIDLKDKLEGYLIDEQKNSLNQPLQLAVRRRRARGS
ncbi:hypothetical protein CLG94_03585 [Candidatus Methylomirabilis limnetica]|uniref:Uncharacterized protein n=1 Tax=Candidatus Methylomirabilis limnetica TaxID=2033718 RepID=A0A2T4TZC2_9BACT|nr:hypothetical protein CLG94_03585 [Candidatus Methylomirabilis limnetica]